MSFKQSRMDRHVHIIKNLSKAMYHLTSYGSFDDKDQEALALMLQATSIIATDAHSDLTTESKHPANNIQTAFINQLEKEVHLEYEKMTKARKNKKENTDE